MISINKTFVGVVAFAFCSWGSAAWAQNPEEERNRLRLLEEARQQILLQIFDQERALEEILQSLGPWFVYPQDRERHRTHGLWGPTGTGKTSSLLQLVKLLGLESSAILIDLQQFAEKGSSHASVSFFEDQPKTFLDRILAKALDSENLSFDLEIEGVEFHWDPDFSIPVIEIPQDLIIILDEFQYAATLNEKGHVVNRDRVQAIWEILGNGGKIRVPNPRLRKLKALAKDTSMYLDYMVTTDFHEEVKREWLAENRHLKRPIRSRERRAAKEEIPDDWFHEQALDREVRQRSKKIQEKINAAIKAWIKSYMDREPAEVELDFSKSFFFIAGNLDELFAGSTSVGGNPAFADEFHERSKRISSTQLKAALSKNFTPKDLARLGTHHSIFLPFSKKSYEAAILAEFNRVIEKARSKGVKLEIDPAVAERFFMEYVDPAQGYRQLQNGRPVFLDDPLNQVLFAIRQKVDLSTALHAPVRVRLSLADSGEKLRWSFLQQEVFSSIPTKAVDLQKAYPIEVAERVALYMAARVATTLEFRGEAPKVVSSKRSVGVGGDLVVKSLNADHSAALSFQEVLREMAMTLGGFAFEFELYSNSSADGKGDASALSSDDLESAGDLAQWAAANFAFRDYLVHFGTERRGLVTAVDGIMEEAHVLAREVVLREQNFIRELAKVLVTQTRVLKAEIESLQRQYWVGNSEKTPSCQAAVKAFLKGQQKLTARSAFGFQRP